MDILHVASECDPLAKTGGLADVLGALPAALARQGHQVTVVLPGYRTAFEKAKETTAFGPPIDVQGPLHGFRLEPVSFERDGVRYVLLRCDELFDRSNLYGSGGRDYADNALRFIAFARAAASLALYRAHRPHILHAHDWQAALSVALVAAARPRPREPRTVLTIHNLAYQGVFDTRVFPYTGLPAEAYSIESAEYYGGVGFLKAGIVSADALTTVSPTYAHEIQTHELGRGLDGVLRARASRLRGILNGIDAAAWNPATDSALPHPFSRTNLAGRALVKKALLQELDLDPDPSAPLVATVARLDPQKGFDLICDAAPEMLAAGARLAILGTGDPVLEERIRSLARRFPKVVAARLTFDGQLAKRFYGASDLFLVPSRFEPCGLNQLYAMRYGSVPIVRRTGGLNDTVTDTDQHPEHGTGFVFDKPTAEALLEAFRRALAARSQPERFASVQARGMARDDSWDGPAREYARLYEELVTRPSGVYRIGAS